MGRNASQRPGAPAYARNELVREAHSPPRQPFSRAAEGRVYGRQNPGKQQFGQPISAVLALIGRAVAPAWQEFVNRSGARLCFAAACPVRNWPADQRVIPAAEQLIRKGRRQTEGDRFASAGGEDGLVALVPFGRLAACGGR